MWFRTSKGLVVELCPPNVIRVREKGRRTWRSITADDLLFMLVKNETDSRREEKRKRKKSLKVKRGMLGKL
jgi:hypothetical protein